MSIDKILDGFFFVTTLSVDEELAFRNPTSLLMNYLKTVQNEPTSVTRIDLTPQFYTVLDIESRQDKWALKTCVDNTPDRIPPMLSTFCDIPVHSSRLGPGVIAEFRRGSDTVAQILTSEEFSRRKKQP